MKQQNEGAKTYEQCKDEVAKQYGYKDFDELMTEQDMTAWANCEMFMDKAAELYAAQFTDSQKKEEVSYKSIQDAWEAFIPKGGILKQDFCTAFELGANSTRPVSVSWLSDEDMYKLACEMFGYGENDELDISSKNNISAYIEGMKAMQEQLRKRVIDVDPMNELKKWVIEQRNLSHVNCLDASKESFNQVIVKIDHLTSKSK